MDFVDYYKILNVNKNATQEEIKAAYRKLARKLHPDLNPNDKDAKKKFQDINEANEVLGDPENRKKYDEYGKDWKHSEQFEKAKQEQGQQRTSQHYSGNDFGGGEDFSDFFESMFGGRGKSNGGRSQAKFRGQDFNAELHLSLTDAFQTHKQTLAVNGKNIRITIPAGIENGQTIKISGHGEPGINGGPNGDLYITFSIANDPKFKRDGNSLHETVDLDLYTSILGGEIMIDTMSGKVKVNVKPETENGSKIKLKGKGFPIYKQEGGFGDLFVTFNIKIPKNLTGKEKELFEQLSKLRS
jgi:curved DNA-binding protein